MSSTQSSASVSIVLCTYNGAPYLEQQLKSIEAQTLQPFELIACDDGSTDATLDLLAAFQRRACFQVRVIRNLDRLGSTANFDQAMQRASSEYIALVDQDDVWLPEKLQRLVPLLDGDPGLGGVFSDAYLLDSRAPTKAQRFPKTLWSMHGFNSRKQSLFRSRAGATGLLLQADVITGATLLLRASLRSLWHPIPPSWVHDGWIAWMLALYARVCPVPEPLMLYRLHGDQQLGLGSANPLAERVQAIQLRERARYARVAGQFEDLLRHVQETGMEPVLEEELRSKIDLLRRRADLPTSNSKRFWAVLADGPAYRRYARGWRSMRKDLFLG